jgi:hypothetical protein
MTAQLRVGELFVQLRELLELERVTDAQGLERIVSGADVSSPCASVTRSSAS